MPRARILVIDDEEIIRDGFTRVLKPKGYQVVCVENGHKAIEKIKETMFDVIFLDIIMPGMNGLETYKAIKIIRPKVKVVMITGYDAGKEIEETLKLGAYGFIRKPPHIAEVRDIIEKALEEK